MTKDLVERLRSQAFDRYAPKDLLNQAADALQSRIAEVERLTDTLQFYRDAWEEHSDPENSGLKLQPDYNLLYDEGDKARAALSQHRKL